MATMVRCGACQSVLRINVQPDNGLIDCPICKAVVRLPPQAKVRLVDGEMVKPNPTPVPLPAKMRFVNVVCPSCETELEVSKRRVGDVVRCPACGSDFQPTNAIPKAPVLTGNRPKKSGSYGWVVALVLGITLPIVACSGFCLLIWRMPGAPNNARCPGCGHEFFISKRSVAEQRDIPCFRCGLDWPAAMVYVGDIKR